MAGEREARSVAHVLRIATAAEVVLLIVSAFFLFTEHRAHYLGALPYGLTAVVFTVFLVFVAEHESSRRAKSGRANESSRPNKGG